ncbi:MAG: beta-ketoacyl-[Bacteroidales bacterium]|nr:beta-ketoacyl-[acyl-carrier-protein] synthase family protein [Bacteroidales bacterium]
MAHQRIYITGMGIVSALGVGKTPTLEALLTAHSGIGPMRNLQGTVLNHYPVGEVPLSDPEMQQALGLDPSEPCIRTGLMGMMAAQEAVEQAQFARQRPERTALLSGTTVGGMDRSERHYLDFFEGKHTHYVALHNCASFTDQVAQRTGPYDICSTLSTACSSAANAIIMGANLIATGRADAVVAGGSECLSKFHLNGFHTLMIIDKQPCRPFDRQRAGLNLGEGAAFVVLESEQSMRARGVEPLCQLSGYANTCDAFHQTATSANGQGPYLAMKSALQMANLQPSDIDYINAHGTGTPNNDISEGIAIERVFGQQVPHTSSTKPFTGHTTSAAGSVEAVISILALQHRFVPANLNLKQPIEELHFTPVSQTLRDIDLHHVLSNSFGFGGNDSAYILSKV